MLVSNKRKKIILTMEDVYFSDDYEKYLINCDCDIVSFIHCKKSIKNSRIFHTLLIDLTKDSQILFSEMRRSYRQQINKIMEIDSIKVVIISKVTKNDIFEYVEKYNIFAKLNGIKMCNYKLLEEMSNNKALVLSYIKDVSTEFTFCGHASLLDKERIYCLFSFSNFHFYGLDPNNYKNTLAGANKYLHWRDMLFFKEKGFKVYDIGGLALDETDKKRSNIDNFKKGFGGFVVTEYNFYHGKTLLGKLALKITKKDNNSL